MSSNNEWALRMGESAEDATDVLNEPRPSKSKLPEFRENENGGLVLHVNNSEQIDAFEKALGATDDKVAIDRLTGITRSDPREYPLPYLADVTTKRMAAMDPKDEIEATLMAQMLTLDEQFRRLIVIGNHDENDGEVRNKCRGLALRMTHEYGEHVKVLTRYRSGGEQIVRHVHVYEGGQAAFIEGVKQQG